MSFAIFKDGAEKPFLECSAMGSKDIDGKLFLVADGVDVEVTEKLIVADAQQLPDGNYRVLDVLEPNDVRLARQQEINARAKEAAEKAEAARIAFIKAQAEASVAEAHAAFLNGAVQKREPA